MITYRFSELQAAVQAIDEAEAAMKGKHNAQAGKLLDEAKALAFGVPISAKQASDPSFNGIFKVKRKTAKVKVTGRQAEVEKGWDNKVVGNYRKAEDLAKKAKSML
jgi:hypothetical protein